MDACFYVHPTATVKDTVGHASARVYKECGVSGSQLGENVIIGDFSRVFNCRFDERVEIMRHCLLMSCDIGRYTYAQKNASMWYCSVGAFCSISWNASIGGANHDYERMTTHAFLYNQNYGFLEKDQPAMYDRFEEPCEIGNDVWIASNACICRGVKVHDGAVIAAGAVVTKDVPPYTIVGGVPAKPIKKRFDDQIIKHLQASRWWELPAELIKENIALFNRKSDLSAAKAINELSKRYRDEHQDSGCFAK